MFQDYFDKVWVINLAKSKGRLAAFEDEADKIGLKYERFPAYDGVKNKIKIGKETEGWNQGAAGLVRTTIKIIRDAKNNGYKNVMIFEDDAVFNNRTKKTVSQVMNKVPEDWELIHFCTKHIRPAKWVGSNLSRIKSAWRCQAYAINENVYDELLRLLNKMDKPLDEITARDIHPKGNSYCPNINAVDHPLNYSTIRQKVIDYRFE